VRTAKEPSVTASERLIEHMSGPISQIQWYLARDGQQYGPLSEAELRKFIELGHLQPTDLLWREGFPDWRPAIVVFPRTPQAAPQTATAAMHAGPAAAQRARADPRQAPHAGMAVRGGHDRPEPDEEETGGGRRWVMKTLIVLLILAALGGAGWFAYPHIGKLKRLTALPGVPAPAAPPAANASTKDMKDMEVPPFAGFKGSAQAIGATLQRAPLWRLIKRDFPDWYADRLKEAVAMAADNKDDTAIGEHMAKALVLLRRQQVDNALSARLDILKGVAVAFYNNLAQLQKYNADACFGFISQGEANPAIVALLKGSPQTALLQAQLVAVFEAIAEGRKTPRVYPAPRRSDYELLAANLKKRGWSDADMQLFSDEKALAQAEHSKVCQMVHDWFAVQLAIPDQDTQLRLLVDSLRPVVAG
jgi:hypothetical protein